MHPQKSSKSHLKGREESKLVVLSSGGGVVSFMRQRISLYLTRETGRKGGSHTLSEENQKWRRSLTTSDK